MALEGKDRSRNDQLKYVKWLGLDRCIPDHIVVEEAKRDKIRIKAGQKAIKFEERVDEKDGRELFKEFIREQDADRVQAASKKERVEYLKGNGVSQSGLEQLTSKGQNVGMRMK